MDEICCRTIPIGEAARSVVVDFFRECLTTKKREASKFFYDTTLYDYRAWYQEGLQGDHLIEFFVGPEDYRKLMVKKEGSAAFCDLYHEKLEEATLLKDLSGMKLERIVHWHGTAAHPLRLEAHAFALKVLPGKRDLLLRMVHELEGPRLEMAVLQRKHLGTATWMGFLQDVDDDTYFVQYFDAFVDRKYYDEKLPPVNPEFLDWSMTTLKEITGCDWRDEGEWPHVASLYQYAKSDIT
ncbi:hypothetical protein JYU14_04435 [Simkania negevensis]|uniref:Uncharacterized protein n=1 Tax=Simkania negevensis TaxID=83561 RepID=A0ABS3AWG7_9BACT|nr:hypothetical protein [Simkania negevensis]